MTSRASFYVGEPLARLLDGFENRSGRLNTIASHYAEITRAMRPSLSRAEWCAVCDALNGYWLAVDVAGESALRGVWIEIADADRLNGLGEKWGTDARALADRVRDMSFAELVAIAEVVERFWLHCDRPIDEALRMAGVTVDD